jgi:uncharacterized membrane protein
MDTVESVTDTGGRQGHWVVRGPGGKTVEYDTIITRIGRAR